MVSSFSVKPIIVSLVQLPKPHCSFDDVNRILYFPTSRKGTTDCVAPRSNASGILCPFIIDVVVLSSNKLTRGYSNFVSRVATSSSSQYSFGSLITVRLLFL